MKRTKVTGKGVRKLHRLARELEAANGVQVRWGLFRIGAEQFFFFEPVLHGCWKALGRGHFAGSGGSTIKEALEDFYNAFLYVLAYDEKSYYQPARFPAATHDGRPRLRGKQLVIINK